MSSSSSAKYSSCFSPLFKGAALLLAAVVVAACSSGDDLVSNRDTLTGGGGNEKNAWFNFESTVYSDVLQPYCSGCHNLAASETAARPYFAFAEGGGPGPQLDYAIANDQTNAVTILGISDTLTLFDKTNPANSGVVQKVASGHNCGTGVDACTVRSQQLATQIQAWIDRDNGGVVVPDPEPGTFVELGLINTLDAPLDVTPTAFLSFPDSQVGLQYGPLHETLKANCSGCHSDVSKTPQVPFFAVDDIQASYVALKDNQKIDILDASKSRIIYRVVQQSHQCWSVFGCVADGEVLRGNIQTFIDSLDTAVEIPANWVKSQALQLYEGQEVSGGVRYEPKLIAKYEFKDGSADPNTTDVKDGVSTSQYPAMDLQFRGNVKWVSGWGVQLDGGFLTSDNTSAKKLYSAITVSDTYSIEAWVIPVNATQGTAVTPAVIAGYGYGEKDRNFTLGQALYNYTSATRLRTENAAGPAATGEVAELIHTDDAAESLQATLQHVVVTYDYLKGRRFYVNGEEVYADTAAPGGVGGGAVEVDGKIVGNWGDDFFFTVGADSDGKNLFRGTMRMLAIHNEAISAENVLKNFQAGVGQKFNLMFKVGHLDDDAANTMHDQSYILFTVDEFDDYSYRFSDPLFVVLDNEGKSMTGSVAIKGMRIGLNGKLPEVGQVYGRLGYDDTKPATLSWGLTSTTLPALTENGPLRTEDRSLSSVLSTESVNLGEGTVVLPFRAAGTILAKQNGANAATPDQFFLTFEQLADKTDVRTADVRSPIVDLGYLAGNDYNYALRNFDEVYATLIKITGVDPNTANSSAPSGSEPKVKDVFNKVREALPAIEDAQTFVSANQVAITKLTFEFCNALVDDSTKRAAFFNVGGTFNFGADVATAFAAPGKAIIVDSLLAKVVGSNIANQPSDDVIKDILTDEPSNLQSNVPGLYGRLVANCDSVATGASCTDSSRTPKVVKSMCMAVLGSAAMLIQ